LTDLGTTYLLRIYLKKSRYINIGKLGKFYFRSGYYFYVGSAKKNLSRRIERHRRKKKKKFWHIDYLLQYAKVKKVLMSNLSEEKLASLLSKKLSIPVKGFGSSDKKSKAHLFFSEKGTEIKNRLS
jgi:Uri superfamily endonuclease